VVLDGLLGEERVLFVQETVPQKVAQECAFSFACVGAAIPTVNDTVALSILPQGIYHIHYRIRRRLLVQDKVPGSQW
jgi:hypothetical protein